MRDIYRRRSVLSARRQKLAIKKLEKETFKTCNIKALWQHNRDLSLNFKANTPASGLTESLISAPGEDTNSAHLFSNIT